MECPKCGFMMDAFTVDCPRCTRLGKAAPAAPPPHAPQPAMPQVAVQPAPVSIDEPTARPSTCGLHIVAFFLPLVGFIIAAIYMANTKRNMQIAGRELMVTSIACILLQLEFIGIIMASIQKHPSTVGFLLLCNLLTIVGAICGIVVIRNSYTK